MKTNFPPTAFPGAMVRAEELEYIINCIRQGQCCAVVGPSNTGKSFLLKSLPMKEVQQQAARQGQQPPVMVFIDCLEAGDSEQAFYELMLRRTLEELVTTDVSASTIESLRDLHREVLHSTTDVAIRSLYGSSVRRLSQEALTLVLIFDEFYDVFQHLPPWPFRQLRALYDALGIKICYITATSHHLEQLRDDTETYEFRELFHLHTLMLRPLSVEDTRRFLTYLAERQNGAISDENGGLLIEWSGGHPGLLERMFTMVMMSGHDLQKSLPLELSELLQKRPILKECQRLWSELQAEQEAILTLVDQGAPALTKQQLNLLRAKGLVTATSDALTLFSPLFHRFVEQELIAKAEVENKGLRCDFATGQIWVDGEEMTLQLSEPQRKLINFLYEKAGTICPYDSIAIGVWGIGEGVSPGAIYELVKRVRQKIEPDWKNPHYIITVPGKGYRLENTAS